LADADPSKFVRLLVQHQDALMRYVLPLVGSLQDAQDVVQETAAALWKKFDQYDQSLPFLPWAKRFARYEVLMHHRKKRRYTFLSESLVESLAESHEGRHTAAEQRRIALRDCLAKLPEADRRLVERRYAEKEATVQQLAEETGQTANVLYKSLARIRRALQECVTDNLADVM